MSVTTITEAYPADRAAALAGVPRSTLHYWASHDIWVPSVSPEKVRLWSLSDIVVLRLFHWLRRAGKLGPHELPIRRTKMPQVRHIAGRIASGEFSPATTRIFVDARGDVVLDTVGVGLASLSGQIHLGGGLAVLAEYRVDAAQGIIGPDLFYPRPLLRIIPGKLAGEPHVVDTRIPTTMLDSMIERGYRPTDICDLYPFLTPEAIDEARSLEQQLRRNLRQQAA